MAQNVKPTKDNLLRVIAFAIIIVLVPVGILFSKKQSVSPEENKVLAEMPKLSANSYITRDFMTGFSSYISDHFIFREPLVGLKNSFEKATFKNEINGVLNVDGSLLQIFRNPDETIRQNNMKAINAFTAKHSGTIFALAPTAMQYNESKLPFYAYYTSEKSYIDKCGRELKSAKNADLSSVLTQKNGNYLYYRTDHHWTSNGAFNAYCALSKQLGFTAYNKNDFDITAKSDTFKGTLYSKTFDKSVADDSILQYTLKKNESKINITDMNSRVINESLYYASRLDEKDKYSYFLGGNKGIININNETDSAKGSLLLIKDSYANSLIPFLSKHFSQITVIDLRYASLSDLKALDGQKYEKALILYNVIGFSQETTLSKLKFIK